MKQRKRWMFVALAALILVPALTGCQASAPQLSKQEETNFKGGPMPDSARQQIAQRMKSAQQNGRPVAPVNAPPRK